MKKLIIKILDFCIDFTNKRVAMKALPYAESAIIDNHVSFITKEALSREISIRGRIELSDTQLDYVLKGLEYSLLRHKFGIKVRRDEIWIYRPQSKLSRI